MIFRYAVLLILPFAAASMAQEGVSRERCLEDLAFVTSSIRKNHPNMFHRISEDAFDALISDFKDDLDDEQSELACYLALKSIVASVQDGHTQLYYTGRFGIENLRYPFRMEQFSDGVFLLVIRKDYEEYLGAKVVTVNGMLIDEVLRRTTSITSMDNRFGRIRPAVQDLTFAMTPFGLGITETESSIELELITRKGETATVSIEAVSDDSPIRWSNRLTMAPTVGEYVSATTLLGPKLPLHLKNLGESLQYYWFEHLHDERAIYLQFNQVADQDEHFETWAEFSNRLWAYIDVNESDIDKLIIDLRYNDGGVARRFMPFLNRVIRSEKLNMKGGLFVLSSNRTFSASVIIMTEFAVHTDAIFVGTPAASPFNSFSDMTYIGTTPNIGAGLLVSARQNDNSWSDYRDFFPPDIPAPFSSTDYFSGVDPALAAIFSSGYSRPLTHIAIDEGAEVAFDRLAEFRSRYADVDWYVPLHPEYFELALFRQGQRLIRSANVTQACAVFELSALIFPESSDALSDFADCRYLLSDYVQATEYYRKTLELDPDNQNAKSMLESIREKLN